VTDVVVIELKGVHSNQNTPLGGFSFSVATSSGTKLASFELDIFIGDKKIHSQSVSGNAVTVKALPYDDYYIEITSKAGSLKQRTEWQPDGHTQMALLNLEGEK
jgi:hypothetical protein